MDFGKIIKNLRIKKGLSQEELAKLLGVSRSAVGNYEVNQNMPSTEVLNKMAEIFGCSIDYIMGRVDLNDFEITILGGVKGLNETNRMIIKNTMDALLDKQKKDESKK